MTYPILQSSTQSPLLFFMVQSSDHISALTGATPTVTISKAGGTFASPSGAVSEIANGWYKVAGNATDTGTLGPIALHATAASGDPCDIVVAMVVAYDPQSALATPTNITAGTITTTTNLTNLPSIPNNWLTAAGIAASALNGKGDWNIGKTGYSLSSGGVSAIWQDTTAGDFTVALSIGKSIMNGVALGTGLTINGYTGNTPQTGDAYARLGAPAGASVSADIAAVKTDTAGIKTQTDKLAFTVANQVDANVLDWKSATAPAMTGDAFARLGAPAGASIAADIAAIPTTHPGIRKNVALANFQFLMTDSTNHNPLTGATVSVVRSIDGAAFAAGTIANIAEIANGWYKFDFGSGDLNGTNIAVRCTATGADDLDFTIHTDP